MSVYADATGVDPRCCNRNATLRTWAPVSAVFCVERVHTDGHMSNGEYLVSLLVAPAAAVVLWWAAAAISTPDTNWEWLVLFALLPPGAALAWTVVRTRSIVRTAVIAVAMMVSILVMWFLVILLVLLLTLRSS